MSFGTLGATSSAAVDNAANLLAMLKAVTALPQDVITQLTALLEELADQQAALERTQKDIAAQMEALAKLKAEVEAKQAALDEHVAKMRKLIQ